ncbi:MAG: hypothetical protein KGL37_00190, partial [Acidobacteriota bacterium]|nr:hypothetical protein [Acidobacteriota bacterium]
MEAYLGGANLQSSTRFLGTAHQAEAVELSNYYLRDFLDEHKLTSWGTLASSALLVLLLGAAFRPTQNTSPAPLAGAALALPSPHPEPLVQSP